MNHNTGFGPFAADSDFNDSFGGGASVYETLAYGSGLETLPEPEIEKPVEVETVAEIPVAEADGAPVAPATIAPTTIHRGPVRTGQTLIAEGDLIVVGKVSNGAELIARGNIHVYGALFGKAYAGNGGDRAANVFVLACHAELISVAGYYRTFEVIPADLFGQAAEFSLDGEALQFVPLAR
jgi:septum site-determining protein MinC